MRSASRLLLRDFLEVRLLRSSVKGTASFADRALKRAESSIVEELRGSRPHYGFLCRSLGEEPGSDPTRGWAISAVDGLTNYSHGIPHWVMTLALLHKGNPVLSVIFNPLENELFTAETGGGSWLNSSRIRTTKTARLSEFTVGTEGLSSRQSLDPQLARLRNVAASVANVRAFGSVSLDLANVSCGRLDAFWSDHRRPSSLPAASLLLAEAGGLIDELEESTPGSDGLVAAGSHGFGAFASLARGKEPELRQSR